MYESEKINYFNQKNHSTNLIKKKADNSETKLVYFSDGFDSKILQCKQTARYLNPIPTTQARHHIIPDSILRKFIQRVRKYDYNVFLQLIEVVKHAYIQYHNITSEEIQDVTWDNFKLLPKNARGSFLILIALTKKEDPHDYEDEMQEAFIWSPGNLVLGPVNRENDPGDEFDLTAALNAGIPLGAPHNESLHIPSTGVFSLRDALSMMQSYIDETIPHPDPAIIEKILIPHILSGIHDGGDGKW